MNYGIGPIYKPMKERGLVAHTPPPQLGQIDSYPAPSFEKKNPTYKPYSPNKNGLFVKLNISIEHRALIRSQKAKWYK